MPNDETEPQPDEKRAGVRPQDNGRLELAKSMDLLKLEDDSTSPGHTSEAHDHHIKPNCSTTRPFLKVEPQEIDLTDTTKCPPVVLVAGGKRELRPSSGKYSIMSEYLRPCSVSKWSIVVLFDQRVILDVERGLRIYQEIESFASHYVRIGQARGCSISKLHNIIYVPGSPNVTHTVETMAKEELKRELRNLVAKLNDEQVMHALFILPTDCPVWVHGYLQYLETSECGSVKQVGKNNLARTSRMQYDTLMRLSLRSRDKGQTHLIPQLWLKYNTKLGGVNIALKKTFDTHDLTFLNDGHLILSIDISSLNITGALEVTDTDVRSSLESAPIAVVGLVAMWNIASKTMSFNTQTRVQRMSNTVENLGSIVREILTSYQQRTDGCLPKSMIIFRSGLLTPKSVEVAREELTSIKVMLASDCRESGDAVNLKMPLLTYLRVPKAKRIRKFEPVIKKPTLVQSGSMVESLMAPDQSAQAGLSSSSTLDSNLDNAVPTQRDIPDGEELYSLADDTGRFTRSLFKLYDENNLSVESLQAMVHSLSYLSPRTTSRTRPTPIDLADLANERTRHISIAWLDDRQSDFGLKSGSFDSKSFIIKLNEFLANLGDHDYRNSLYYA